MAASGLLIGALMLAIAPLAGALPAGQKPPNIALIVLDATRADHLSCYGYSRPTTPHIDRLADQGVLYENCITPGSWTLPSIASLFTGLFPRDHGVNSQNLKLAPDHTTLAEVLAAAGYQTMAFSTNAWLGSFSGLEQGFDSFIEVWREIGKDSLDDGAGRTNFRVSSWLDRRDASRPFFIYVHYFEPHLPYRPPPPHDSRFLPSGHDPKAVNELKDWAHPRELGHILKVDGLTVSPAQFDLLTALYDGEIAYLDERVGDLTRELAGRGLLDETVVVLVADHGEHLGEHGLMDHKMSLYEELIRVPLIIRYPGEIPAGRRIRSQVQTVDLFSTLLAWAGLPAAGTSSRRLPLEDSPGAGRDYTYAEFSRPDLFLEVVARTYPSADLRAFDRALAVVRGDRFKLIWGSDGRHELYDLRKDPGEKDDLADRENDWLLRLLQVWEAFRSGSEPK